MPIGETVKLFSNWVGSLVTLGVERLPNVWDLLADLLKRRYRLVDLKVSLDASSPEPVFSCQLEVDRGGQTKVVKTWTAKTAEIGLPADFNREQTRGSGYPFNLPNGLGHELQTQLETIRLDGTLWLHLARP